MFYELHQGDIEFNRLEPLHLSFFENNFSFFYSGRHAIHAILESIANEKDINTIWLPSYFCHNVINSITSVYDNVKFYKASPFSFENDATLPDQATENDVLLLNNYWGLKSFHYSEESEKLPTIIEDHSHGWLSEACVNSKADYCISSLRKSYPIPLGAIAWRNPNKSLNFDYIDDDQNSMHSAFRDLNQAQALKRALVKQDDTTVKAEFLNLLSKAEDLVSQSTSIIKPRSENQRYIKRFMRLNPNRIKQKNLEAILSQLRPSEHFKILSNTAYTPFGLLLLFSEQSIFMDFKNELIVNNIYPANLWPNNDSKTYPGHLLNLHIDFRYGDADIEYLVDNINLWIKKH